MICVLDIETTGVVTPEMRDYLIDKIRTPGNLKDPEKIRRAIEERAVAIDEKAALSPLTGEVAIVGLAYGMEDATEPSVDVLTAEGPGGERGMLTDLALRIESWRTAGELTLVTYNGKRFDLPYIAGRAAILGLPLPLLARLPAPRARNHIDLLDVLGDGSLEQWSIALGLGHKQSSGAEVPAMIRDGRWQEACDHCRADVMVTWALYRRLASCVDVWR